jgi:CRP-like cAMP-binding protein
MSSRVQEFETLSLWEKLAPADRAKLRGQVRVLRLHARQVLVKDDAPFAGLHIVKSGNLKLCRTSKDKEQILDILGPGDVVDPIPLFDGGAHAVTAKTMTPVEVYCFSPEAAQKLIAEYPAVLHVLLNILSLRLRKLAALANDLAFKDVTSRVCRVLLEQATFDEVASDEHVLARPLTRQELASLVGTAREVAWRALKNLEHDGLIEIHGQHITILDAAALASRA